MQLVMQNFFTTETAAVEVAFDLPDNNNMLFTRQPQGIYCNLGSDCIGLFVQGKKLFLYLNGLASEVYEQRVTVSLHQDGVIRQLNLTICGLATTVVNNDPRLPVSTQFYSEDEEDSDFGLWLTNVLGSDLRRNTFLQSWQVV